MDLDSSPTDSVGLELVLQICFGGHEDVLGFFGIVSVWIFLDFGSSSRSCLWIFMDLRIYPRTAGRGGKEVMVLGERYSAITWYLN